MSILALADCYSPTRNGNHLNFCAITYAQSILKSWSKNTKYHNHPVTLNFQQAPQDFLPNALI